MDDDHQNPTDDSLPKVVVVGEPFPPFTSLLESYSNTFHLLKAWESKLPLHQFLTTYAQSVEVILVVSCHPFGATLLDCLPSLKLVITSSVGVDHLDLAELRRRRVALANAGNAFTEDVADIAVGLLIDVLRKLSAGDRFVRQRLWSTQIDFQFPLGLKLSGRRIGIVGLGKIGSELANRLEGFDCKISYNSKTKKPNVSYSYYSNVRDLARNSDVLIICCGLTEETHHMINREVMVALGKNGVLINVGRGAIVDEKEMVKCLINGDLGGAGLDVYEDEPNVPEQLFALDNVVLSPHAAVITNESFMALSKVIIDNLEAFFSNNPLVSPYHLH